MEELWVKYRSMSLARLATIERALTALNQGSLTEELRDQAAHDAHKLAGSLGTFGFHAASEAASEIEKLFSGEKSPTGELAAELEKHSASVKGAICS